MQNPTRGRCPAAHPDDATSCDGPPVVTVLDRDNAGADGCQHHAARLLASLDGGRPVSLPDAPSGAALRVVTAAADLRPFSWSSPRPPAAGLAELAATGSAPIGALGIPVGPVDDEPRGAHTDAEQRAVLLAMLAEAGVELGRYDRRIVEWLAGWDWPTVATVASWVRRTRPATRAAFTCARPNCLGVHLAPLDLDEATTAEAAARAAGWQLAETGHTCPGCTAGHGPVLERGECPRCMGATVDLPAGGTCHYCGHVLPHPPGSEEW